MNDRGSKPDRGRRFLVTTKSSQVLGAVPHFYPLDTGSFSPPPGGGVMWLVRDTGHLFPFDFQAKMRGVVCSLTTLSVSVSNHAGCNLFLQTLRGCSGVKENKSRHGICGQKCLFRTEISLMGPSGNIKGSGA
jgi:hypothetical protein